jgi:murein DD-endopeptidase MepM/ murein hydrolase activator NlpD
MRKDPLSRQVRFHKGLDLAAPEGMKVIAALPGTVISAGHETGYGNAVLIQHSGGLQTRYGHLGSVQVKAGDRVDSEAVLGTVGNTGRSTGPHVHFEVIRLGKPVNPLTVAHSQAVSVNQHPVNLKTGS